MKGCWLFYACLSILLLWGDTPFYQICILFLIFLTFHKKIRGCKKGIVIVLLLLCRCYIPIPKDKPNPGYFKILEIKSSYVVASDGKHKVILYGLENPNFDNVYLVKKEFREIDTIHNFYGFSFENWLKRKHIFYETQLDNSKLVKQGNSVRHMIYEMISNRSEEETTFLKAMLFGVNKEDASFLLLSSGMHIGFLLMLERKFLKRFMKEETGQLLILLQLLVLAACFTLSNSVLRLLCFYTANLFLFKENRKDQLGLGMFFIMFLAPYMVFEISFILPCIFRLAYMFNVKKMPKSYVSISVLFPLQLFYYHEVNPIQIFLFRFLRIVYAVFYFLALLTLLPFVPYFSIYQDILNTLSSIEKIGFTIFGTASMWWIVLWFYIFLRIISYKKKKDLIRQGFLLAFFFAMPYLNPFAQVYMLDVGQGDCSVVILPYRSKVIMIDVMGHLTKNIPEDIIVPFLHAKGIRKIDTLVVTHDDLDHSGGKKQLEKLISVDNVVNVKEKAKIYEEDWMKFLLLDYKGEDANENSIVTYMQFYDTSILFMGDLGIKGEKELLKQYPKLQADILKVGHHGSSTSSSSVFLHKLHPKLALISAGRNNRYQHPHQNVIENLHKENIHELTTKEKGAVSIKICKYFYFYKTVEQEFGIITHR